MDASKVKIEVVKGGKMSFSHSQHNLQRFWFVMAVTTILMFEPDRVRKDVLVVSCLATFISSLVSYGLLDFPTVPIDPPLVFKSWHPTVVIEGQ